MTEADLLRAQGSGQDFFTGLNFLGHPSQISLFGQQPGVGPSAGLAAGGGVPVGTTTGAGTTGAGTAGAGTAGVGAEAPLGRSAGGLVSGAIGSGDAAVLAGRPSGSRRSATTNDLATVLGALEKVAPLAEAFEEPFSTAPGGLRLETPGLPGFSAQLNTAGLRAPGPFGVDFSLDTSGLGVGAEAPLHFPGFDPALNTSGLGAPGPLGATSSVDATPGASAGSGLRPAFGAVPSALFGLASAFAPNEVTGQLFKGLSLALGGPAAFAASLVSDLLGRGRSKAQRHQDSVEQEARALGQAYPVFAANLTQARTPEELAAAVNDFNAQGRDIFFQPGAGADDPSLHQASQQQRRLSPDELEGLTVRGVEHNPGQVEPINALVQRLVATQLENFAAPAASDTLRSRGADALIQTFAQQPGHALQLNDPFQVLDTLRPLGASDALFSRLLTLDPRSGLTASTVPAFLASPQAQQIFGDPEQRRVADLDRLPDPFVDPERAQAESIGAGG